MKKVLVSFSLLFLLALSVFAQGRRGPQIDTVRLWPDGAPNAFEIPGPESGFLVFGAKNYELAMMEVYPAREPNGLCVIMCPGGAYVMESQTHEGRDLHDWFNARGITYCMLQYRLPVGHHEVPLSDLQQAIRIMRSRTDLGITKVGVMGNSAGGHLAAMISIGADQPAIEGNVGGNLEYSSRVKAAALFYAPIDLWDSTLSAAAKVDGPAQDLTGTEVEDLSNDNANSLMALACGFVGPGRNIKSLGKLIESGDTSDPDWKFAQLLKDLSPISYCSEDNPPVCLFHGAHDPLVDPAQTVKMYQALCKAGADATMICYSYGGHGPSLGEQVDRFAYEFLKDRI